jgi:phosphohistidine phosphatase
MHQLILLRHAKAARETAGVSDHDRPLLPAGRAAAAAIGKAMRKAGLSPDVVLDELETANVWDERPNIDTIPTLYMATVNQIRDCLRDLPETVRSALVIGHNPGLHELAVALSGSPSAKPELMRLRDGYPTASLAEFMVTTTWHKLSPGAAALQRFLQPGDLA